ncbi:hypothetical protein KGR20_10995 [Cytobacillus oceanisediminis]|uniref:Uncharacterized protein n=1 Tax=Niallia circulans TaxID=1397 RepID=A0A941GG89_NIACI|nr:MULTISPECIES: hypothetical protein [Bacillaceae]MDU1846171.1 hypothetical protein [Niallia nealsonii]MBZ9534780.1 hypothetical protein [Cytobacillus oceanisediminis]MCB5239809.1 hypothetical protein [Niallia circulans]MED3793707.1 hypothetical protein [Niallia alba]UTI42773.1 hypothetical protein NKG37_03215 [Niallia sp. RD1]
MIFLWLFAPVAIVMGLVLFFEKKSGMTAPDENKQAEKLGEVVHYNRVNSSGGPGGMG